MANHSQSQEAVLNLKSHKPVQNLYDFPPRQRPHWQKLNHLEVEYSEALRSNIDAKI